MDNKPDEVKPPSPPPAPIERWAALAGRWTFSGSNATYLGPQEGGPPLGIAMAGQKFRSGEVSVKIKLSRKEKTTAGIMFGFQSLNSSYFVAQIGMYNRAYAISEYRPGSGWVSAGDAVGLLANLSIDSPHEMRLIIHGQRVAMVVDGVEVVEVVLRRPVVGSGLGLFGWDDAKIEFSDATLQGLAPRVFIIMPFAEPFDTLYREVIDPVARGLDLDIIRVDEIKGPGLILEDIQRQIEQSIAVVAEISTHNPNVFYELGYAHALRKPAVLLVRKTEGAAMPFDVRGYRAIFYDDTIGGKRVVERALTEHLTAILRET